MTTTMIRWGRRRVSGEWMHAHGGEWGRKEVNGCMHLVVNGCIHVVVYRGGER